MAGKKEGIVYNTGCSPKKKEIAHNIGGTMFAKLTWQ
jgi:hypothetical protein